MRKLFLIVLFSLTIIILSLVYFLKITLIVLAVATCVLLVLYKAAPLKANKAKIKPQKKEKTFRKDQLIA